MLHGFLKVASLELVRVCDEINILPQVSRNRSRIYRSPPLVHGAASGRAGGQQVEVRPCGVAGQLTVV